MLGWKKYNLKRLRKNKTKLQVNKLVSVSLSLSFCLSLCIYLSIYFYLFIYLTVNLFLCRSLDLSYNTNMSP